MSQKRPNFVFAVGLESFRTISLLGAQLGFWDPKRASMPKCYLLSDLSKQSGMGAKPGPLAFRKPAHALRARKLAKVRFKIRGALKGTNLSGHFRRSSMIFADKQSIWEPQIFAKNRRKPQEPAENCRLAFVPLGLSP